MGRGDRHKIQWAHDRMHKLKEREARRRQEKAKARKAK